MIVQTVNTFKININMNGRQPIMKNNNGKHAAAIFTKKTAHRVATYSCGFAPPPGPPPPPPAPENLKSLLKSK